MYNVVFDSDKLLWCITKSVYSKRLLCYEVETKESAIALQEELTRNYRPNMSFIETGDQYCIFRCQECGKEFMWHRRTESIRVNPLRCPDCSKSNEVDKAVVSATQIRNRRQVVSRQVIPNDDFDDFELSSMCPAGEPVSRDFINDVLSDAELQSAFDADLGDKEF